jgi:hypothetical protein
MTNTSNASFLIIVIGLSALLPFSFPYIEIKEIVILFLLAFSFFLLTKRKEKEYSKVSYHVFRKIVFTILILIIFSIVEKLNLIQQFSIPMEIKKRLPFSTILILISIVLIFINAIKSGKNNISVPYLANMFIFVFIGFLIFNLLLFLIVKQHYNVAFSSGLDLLNKGLKYIFIVIALHLPTQSKNIQAYNGIIISISLCIVLILKFVLY